MIEHRIALASTFIWIGMVCAISFMEAWLKFKAPGVTLTIGLSIGALVFNLLNKVEWVFVTLILSDLLHGGWKSFKSLSLFISIPLLILILQTFWLLPILEERAELYIQEKEVAPSNQHLYFIIAEVVKVTCLFLLGVNMYRPPQLAEPMQNIR
jgi:ABC-type amino acid transport system permease subunit